MEFPMIPFPDEIEAVHEAVELILFQQIMVFSGNEEIFPCFVNPFSFFWMIGMELELNCLLGRALDGYFFWTLNKEIPACGLVNYLFVMGIEILPGHGGFVLGDAC